MERTDGDLCATQPENVGSSDDTRHGALAPGHLIADTFRLGRSLGHGGMAEVILARDVVLERDVAIKFLAPGLLTDETFRSRFASEARNMARIQHPNVVQVHSFGVHCGWPYFVMEYIDGVTLARWSRLHRAPSLQTIASIVKAVATALEAIHQAGLVHQDVKPANILMGSDGRVVLTDLGLARLAAAPNPSAGLSGTPRYMAPEQVLRRSLPPSLAARTDVYQLAVTTFELLVGAQPFIGDDAISVMLKHGTEPPPAPTAKRGDLPRSVDDLLLRSMAKDPSERPASALEFSTALAEAVRATAGTPVRVLVVDDDDACLQSVAAVLEAGLTRDSVIIRASNGPTALALVAATELDVVLLDLHMPGMSGLDVARALRASSSEHRPRIVGMTAAGGSEDWRELRALGADALLLKPVEAEQLTASVQRSAELSRR